MSTDAYFLGLALQQAHRAAQHGEVPVGAVLVKEGQVIAWGRNSPVADCDPSAHAEINALRQGSRALGNYRLDGCELFVTLEPCAMCAGAIFHARLARVVYAVAEPKTGSAGSVVNLFAGALNHQTQVQSATELGADCADLARDCSRLIQDFFVQKRQSARRSPWALRPDALRTPEPCFEQLPQYSFAPQYVSDLPLLAGLRMHYLDEGAPDASLTYLCLHGGQDWCFAYRKMIPILASTGARVLAPDLIGFGRSDKPKKETFHRLAWHRQCLLEWAERLDLRNIVLVLQADAQCLGLMLAFSVAQRCRGLLVMPALPVCKEAGVPYPDAVHGAGLRAFAKMMKQWEVGQERSACLAVRAFWENDWQGLTLRVGDVHDATGEHVAQRALEFFGDEAGQ